MRYFLLVTFFLLSQAARCVPSGYSFYKKLTTQENQITVGNTGLTSFPVLVRITDSDLKSVANGGKVESNNGYDIVFTASDRSTLLPFQLEKYDAISGSLVAWVRIPALSATINTDFYVFFGNSSVAVNLGSKSTWDANYRAVYHLHSDLLDGSNNAANLANSTTATTNLSPGLAADGQRLSTSSYLQKTAATGLQLTGDLTLEAWVNLNSLLSGSNENIVLSSSSSGSGSNFNTNYCLSINGSGGSAGELIFSWQFSNNSDEEVTSTLRMNTSLAGWRYISVVRDNTNKLVRFYIDGVQLGSAVSYANSATGGSSNAFLIGKNLADASRSIDAGFDEVRVSNTIRSAEWIQAAYNSYKPASTFVTYSATASINPGSFCFCDVDLSNFSSIGIFNGHTYYISNQATSWQRADSMAKSIGGHLVSITTAAENTFLTLNMLLSSGWTGLNDSLNEGTFVWSNGEPFIYSNWSLLQPDNAGNSDYVLFSSLLGLWDDQKNSLNNFIIEFDCLAPTPFTISAGPDQLVCSNTATLAANPIPASAQGNWSLLSGSGTISNSSSPNATVSGLGNGNNSFLWKASNGSCDALFDTVVITTDTILPKIVCPAPVILNNAAGNCSEIATWAIPTSTDNCGVSTLFQTAGLPNGSTFPVGTSTITYRVVDSNNNSQNCSFTVTVLDVENPKIICPTDQIVNSDPGACGAFVSGISPISPSDNCGTFTIDYQITGATSASGTSDASGVFFSVGNSLVRYTITDAAGRSTGCTFNVVVADNTAPTFTFCPPDISLEVNAGLCTAVASWTPPVAFDNCPGLNLVQVNGLPSGSAFPVGANNIKYVATDAKGLTSTCAFTIFVVDTIPPTISSCPTNLALTTNPGSCSAIATWASPLVSDNCSGATISQITGLPSGSTFPIGVTTISYKATDVNNLSSLCSFSITVTDGINPIILNCPTNLFVPSTPGFCGANVTWPAPSVTDNCSGATISQTTGPSNGTFFPVGTTPVSYQAFDVAGNTATCNFSITVTDTELPQISCPAPVSVTNDPGVCTAIVNGISPLSSNDNCSGTVINYLISGATNGGGINDASGQQFNLGTSTVTYSIRDATGAQSTCAFDVTVTSVPTTADAGPNQTLCDTFAVMAANTPLVGTGTWTLVSGGGLIANPLSPLTSISVLPIGTSIFRWTIASSPCTASFSDVSITVVEKPSQADAGSNQTICASSVTLNANIPLVGNGNWSLVSGLGSFANPSVPNTTVTALGNGTSVFKWTIVNGICPVTSDTVTITNFANPTLANAGPDQVSICATNTTVLAANNPGVGLGQWSILTGAGGSFSSLSNPAAIFTGIPGNTYQLRWTISNLPCTSNFDDVSISFVNNPSTANAGPDQNGASTCGQTSLTLAANTPLTGNGLWTIVSGGSGTFSNSSLPNTTFSGAAGAFYVLRWTITTLCGSSFDDVSIIFNQNPSLSNAGIDQTLACNASSTSLLANTPLIGTGVWTIVSGNGGSFSGLSNPLSSFTGVLNTNSVEVYSLRWTISNPPCLSNSDVVTISLPAVAALANAGIDQTANCGITSTALSAQLPANHTGTWSIVSGGAGSFNLTNNPSSIFSGASGNSYQLRWTITQISSGCNSFDDVQITFPLASTQADAGLDQTNAVTCGLTNTTLSANTPSVGTGTWSIQSGLGGTLQDPSNPLSTFTGAVGIPYTLRWTITNSPCPANFDEVTILFNTPPTPANAGPDQILCGVASTTLAANSAINGVGSWTVISGLGGSFITPTSPTTIFNGLTGESYVLRWTIQNLPCASSVDEVAIHFDSNPTPANAGINQTICTSSSSLSASIPLVGNGNWSLIAGSAVFANPSSPTTAISGLSVGNNVVRWTISTTSCGASSADVTISVTEQPSTANAGNNQIICVPTTLLNAAVPIVGAGAWLKLSGSGILQNPSNPNSAISGLTPGTTVLLWSVSNGICPVSSDTISITVNSNPTLADAGLDQTICGNATVLAGNMPLSGTGIWTLISGSGTFSNPSAATTAVSNLGIGSNVFRWTISNAPCSESFDEVSVNVSTIPAIANAGPDQINLCGTTSTILAANAAVGSTIGTWTIVSGLGASFGNANSPTSSFTGMADSSYVLRWSISSPGCTDSFDEISIRFNVLPSSAVAGNDLSLCETTGNSSLAAISPLSGSGLWSVISGTGNFSNATLATTSVNGFSIGLNSFVWTVSNVCGSNSDTLQIVVDALPTAANAGIDQTICENIGTLNLNANQAVIGNGSWSVQAGTGIVANPNSFNTGISNASLGQNNFVWSIANGVCPSSSDTVSVTLEALPTLANAGADTSICSGTFALQANIPISGFGVWNVIAGNGTIALAGSASTTISGLSAGINSIVWNISNGSCGSTSDTLHISVSEAPGLSFAGANQSICSDSAILLANAPLSGTGNWSLAAGSGTFSNPNSPNTVISGLLVGATVVRWTVSNGVCPSDSSELTLTRNPENSSASAGNDTLICGNTLLLHGNIPVVGSGLWTVINGSGTLVNASSSNSLITGLSIGINRLEWRIGSAVCPANVDTIAITVTSIPAASNAGVDQTNLCGLTSTLLDADTTNQANGSWSIVSGGGGTFSSVFSPTALFTGMPDTNYILRWTITDLICSSSSDDVVIRFDSPPSIANAGADQTNSLTCGLTAITLAATPPNSGIGNWTIVSGAGGTISGSGPSAILTGNAGNTYILEWAVSNSCASSKDTVTITFNENPSNANAGNNQHICENASMVQLTANIPLTGNGNWSTLSGSGTFSNSNSANTTLSNFAGGLNQFLWTISSTFCGSSLDTLDLLVDVMPSASNAGPDINSCENISLINLAASPATSGTAFWKKISGVGILADTLNPTTTLSSLSTGSGTFVWMVQNGLCPISSDTVQVFVSPLPSPSSAGVDLTICENTASISLSATPAIVGVGAWSVLSGTAAFFNPNSESSPAGGFSTGQNTLLWSISSGSCPISTDTLTVFVNALPSLSNAGIDQHLCESVDSIQLSGNQASIGVGAWQVLSGGANLSDSLSNISTAVGLSVGQNKFVWTITNGACQSRDTLLVLLDALPTVANAGIDKSICVPFTTLKADSAYIGTGIWTQVSGAAATILHPGYDTTAVLGMSIGINSFAWTVTNGICPASSDTVSIAVNPSASSSNAGLDQTICSSTDTVFLSGNNPVLGIGRWRLVSGTGVIIDSTSANTGVTGLGIGTSVFAWIIKNGICFSSDAVTITVDALPNQANAGSNQTICETNSNTLLAATAPVIGTGTWSGNAIFSTVNSPSTTVSGFSVGTNSFVWTVSNGVCPSSSDTVLLLVDALPSTANAGNNQAVCSTNSSVSLGALTPAIGIGQWQSISGGGIVNDPSNSNSGLSNLSLGLNTFVWTTSNGVCSASNDTVNIVVSAIPTAADAGINQTICESVGIINLGANIATNGTGSWSSNTPGIVFSNPLSETSAANGLSIGINQLYWTISNGICPDSKDSVSILIDALPSAANAGINQSFCENAGSFSLNAIGPAQGSAIWTNIAVGTQVANPLSNTSLVTGLVLGNNDFVWTVSNGVCPSSSDTVTLFLDALPTLANAGVDQVICDTLLSIILDANTAVTGIGSWSIAAGIATIANTSDTASSVNGFGTGLTRFVWTISNGSCPSSSDTVSLAVDSSPTVSNAGQNQEICGSGQSLSLNANQPIVGTGSWSLEIGSGTFDNTNLANSGFTNPGIGMNVLKWTIANGACKSSSTVTIEVDEQPDASNAGEDLTVFVPLANLNANNPTVGTGVWSIVEGSGLFGNDNEFSTQLSGIQVGTTVIRWTINNGVCPSSTDDLVVNYQDLQIPNAISPNNDGINDAFVIPGLDFYPGVRFILYNRWGAIEYQNDQYKNEFKGENSSGQALLEDTYYYTLQISESLEYKGFLIIKK